MSDGQRKWLIVGVVAVATIAIAYWIAARAVEPARADFTLTAETGILRLHTYCAQRLVWDLPPGKVSQPQPMMPGDDEGPASSAKPSSKSVSPQTADEERPDGHVSVAMEGDLFITVSRSAAGDLMVVIQRGDSGGELPLGTVTVSNPREGSSEMERKSQTIEDRLYYRSVDGADPAFTLPLWGRVIVGDDVPQGSGSAAGAAPLLQAATIRARVSTSGRLNEGVPRKTVIDESLDVGDIVDTHPTLAAEQMDAPRVKALCGSKSGDWAAVGFITPGSDGMIKAVVHRNAEAVSVTRASAQPFDLSVRKWQSWLASDWLQGGIIVLVLVATIIGNLNNALSVKNKFWPKPEKKQDVEKHGKS